MRQTWMLAAGLAGVLALAGCSENYSSIFRKFSVDDGDSVVTDAKQRVVTNTGVVNTSPVLGQIEPSRVVCSEPSPDVSQVMSQAFDASLSVSVEGQGGGSGALGYSSAASLAQLGERLATIQLLRDELSSLCQSYANGAVSATTYTLRLSRLDRKMVTLLMAEMASGAFGRNLAALSSAASAGGGSESAELLKARENVKLAADAVKQRRDELDILEQADPPNAEAIATARTELLKAYQDLANKTSAMLALEMTGAGSSALASALGLPGAIDREGRGEIAAGQLVELQLQFLEDDDLGTLIDACVSATNMLFLPRDPEGNVTPAAVADFQQASEAAARTRGAVDDAAFLLDRQIIERGKIRDEIADQEGQLAAGEAQLQDLGADDPARLTLNSDLAEIRRDLVGYNADLDDADGEIEKLRGELAEASQSLAAARAARAKFISPLGQYCDERGLDRIIAVAEQQPDHQIEKIRERTAIIAAEADRARVRTKERCAVALSGDSPSDEIKALCAGL